MQVFQNFPLSQLILQCMYRSGPSIWSVFFFWFIFGNAEFEVIHHKSQAVRSKWKKQKLESQVNVNNCFFICPANYLLVCEMLKLPVFSYIASTVPRRDSKGFFLFFFSWWLPKRTHVNLQDLIPPTNSNIKTTNLPLIQPEQA